MEERAKKVPLPRLLGRLLAGLLAGLFFRMLRLWLETLHDLLLLTLRLCMATPSTYASSNLNPLLMWLQAQRCWVWCTQISDTNIHLQGVARGNAAYNAPFSYGCGFFAIYTIYNLYLLNILHDEIFFVIQKSSKYYPFKHDMRHATYDMRRTIGT